MVRRFGNKLVAVDAAVAVVVVIVVTAAQVWAFYKAKQHEHEAVRARLPPLSRNWWATIKANMEAKNRSVARATAYGQLRVKRVCPLLPM